MVLESWTEQCHSSVSTAVMNVRPGAIRKERIYFILSSMSQSITEGKSGRNLAAEVEVEAMTECSLLA